MRYRKKPVVIEAVQWDGEKISESPQWVIDALNVDPQKPGSLLRLGDTVHIGTIEGHVYASPGDYIIRGVQGEIYPCRADIFAATYDTVAR